MKPSPELVTNGGFDDGTGWEIGLGHSISGGTANLERDDEANRKIRQSGVVVGGRQYLVTYTVLNYVSGSVWVELGTEALSSNGSEGPSNGGGTQRIADGTYTELITAQNGASGYVSFVDNVGITSLSIDNVSVKEIKTITKPSTELITNNGFDTDTDWTKGGGWSISDGVASCDGTGDLRQFPTLTPGNTYRLTYEITAITAGRIRARVGGTNNASDNSTLGFKTEDFVAGSTANRIDIRPVDGFNGSIDNVFLKEVKALIK